MPQGSWKLSIAEKMATADLGEGMAASSVPVVATASKAPLPTY